MSTPPSLTNDERWPALPYAEWKDTLQTLHMWTQVVGKVRLALSAHLNHWWEVPYYVSARGLTTSAIPYGGGIFEIEFDFVEHVLRIETSRGETEVLDLKPQSVADFYREFMAALKSLGIAVKIWPMPVEVANPIRFDEDRLHASYESSYVERFWHILVSLQPIFQEFRSNFLGKSSPTHFFWGSFDLAVTRFSGRRAPERPGADKVTREAYSHEVSSVGWWPGDAELGGPAFYSYAAPEPADFRDSPVKPAQAHYDDRLKEFLLLYDDVRTAADPRAAILEFCQTTYEAAANLGKWDRASLER
ncbi:MAG TPA: DUF5996 family protein [Candidatus Sulfotelmatobacter sp.]|nr:DUF5996 family protein [Candidatus Sulfotelmatobacter sp.]